MSPVGPVKRANLVNYSGKLTSYKQTLNVYLPLTKIATLQDTLSLLV